VYGQGLGLEIHLVRQTRLGRTGTNMNNLDRAGPKSLGPCGQQVGANLYTKIQIHVDGNNASRTENICKPATSTRLTVNCQMRSWSSGYVVH